MLISQKQDIWNIYRLHKVIRKTDRYEIADKVQDKAKSAVFFNESDFARIIETIIVSGSMIKPADKTD